MFAQRVSIQVHVKVGRFMLREAVEFNYIILQSYPFGRINKQRKVYWQYGLDYYEKHTDCNP